MKTQFKWASLSIYLQFYKNIDQEKTRFLYGDWKDRLKITRTFIKGHSYEKTIMIGELVKSLRCGWHFVECGVVSFIKDISIEVGHCNLFLMHPSCTRSVSEEDVTFITLVGYLSFILERGINFRNVIDREWTRQKNIFLHELSTSISISNATEKFYNCLRKTLSPSTL